MRYCHFGVSPVNYSDSDVIFAFLTKKNCGGKDNSSETQLLPIKMHLSRKKSFHFFSTWAEKIRLKCDRLEHGLSVDCTVKLLKQFETG